ncbi:MAG: methionine--tRNA ligase subunit beta [Deltaproteobacteria bacterium]|nr:MAG: methionine--tRNA ligase subunit beta [Deltaproteobacteria bacterium]HEX16354.1 methionine--tRNA ligase subunit beta [Deltaproteobacteria bacterium]
MRTISFEEFKRVELRIGKVVAAERVPGTDRLMRLELDLGGERRQVVAGIAPFYDPGELVGRELPVVLNLEPRRIKGVESQGMILAVDAGGEVVLLQPEKEVPPGSLVR